MKFSGFWKVGTALALSAAMLGLSACSTAGSGTAGNSIKLGIIAPLTGGVSVYGVAASNGAKLALNEINTAGGIKGQQIQVVEYDDKGDSTESVNAYNKLVNNDKVTAIIGPVTSGPTITVASASKDARTPIITPTATNEEVTNYGDNIFRACFLDATQAKTMATFAIDTLGATTGAVLYNSADDYSTTLAENFKATMEEKGAQVVSYQSYTGEGTDYKSQLTEIKSKNPQVLFLPDYYNTVALIIKQAEDVGLDATLLGADGWDGLFTAIDEADRGIANDSYYCSHYSTDDTDPVVQNFISGFQKTYNTMPNSFAALGYDAAKIMAKAVETAPALDNASIINTLRGMTYDGVTGKISFDEKGNPIKSLAIITIQDATIKFHSRVQP